MWTLVRRSQIRPLGLMLFSHGVVASSSLDLMGRVCRIDPCNSLSTDRFGGSLDPWDCVRSYVHRPSRTSVIRMEDGGDGWRGSSLFEDRPRSFDRLK